MAGADLKETLRRLNTMADAARAEHSTRLGIHGVRLLGVNTSALRKLAKEIGPDDALSAQLWESDIHEARQLAVLCADTKTLSADQIEAWLEGVTTWDLCDLIAKLTAQKMNDADTLITRWAKDQRLYMRRSALATIAYSAVHKKDISEKSWQLYLKTVRTLSGDDRLHVKKAASWALREMGKRGEAEHQIILDEVYALKENGGPTQVWIAKDALKELEDLISVPQRRRLISRKSKTGKLAMEAQGKERGED